MTKHSGSSSAAKYRPVRTEVAAAPLIGHVPRVGFHRLTGAEERLHRLPALGRPLVAAVAPDAAVMNKPDASWLQVLSYGKVLMSHVWFGVTDKSFGVSTRGRYAAIHRLVSASLSPVEILF